MSDTPRTDAATFHRSGLLVVEQEIARQLERELNALQKWKDAVIDAAVVGWTYTDSDEDDPRGCISKIMAMHQQIALDPAVSSEAEALIERGRQEMHAEVERLREALEDVIDPISKMERELEDGYNLNGVMAVSLSRDPEYLRSIARVALKEAE